MPSLDQVLDQPPREADRQVLDGQLVQRSDGTYLKVYGSSALYGPVLTGGTSPGDDAAVAIAQDGSPWLLGGGGGGEPGPPGPEGPMGPLGPAGPKGDTGATGGTGPTGATGSQGVKGDTGAQGVPGPQGVKGDTGTQGVKGDTGPPGTVYDTDQIGTVKAFSGKTIPANWMLADGRTLDRATYRQLADVLGVGPSPGTFPLPDLRSKFLLGPKGDLTDVGASGGEAAHLLTTAEAAQKAHTTGTDYPDHAHGPNAGGPYFLYWNGSGTAAAGVGPAAGTNYGGATAGANARHQHDVAGSDAAAAHNNMPPYVVMAWIIKATGVQVDTGGALVGPQGPPGSSVQVPMDTWHVIGAAGEPAYQSGWVNFDGRGVAFRKYPDGKVRLRGLIKNGAIGSAAFTLPVGYRPITDAPNGEMYFPCGTNGTTGLAYVKPDGAPTPGQVVPNVGNAAWFDLSAIEFDTGTVTQQAVGPQGAKGDTGAAGGPVPVGGAAGAELRKASAADGDAAWVGQRVDLHAVSSYIFSGLDGDLDYGYELIVTGYYWQTATASLLLQLNGDGAANYQTLMHRHYFAPYGTNSHDIAAGYSTNGLGLGQNDWNSDGHFNLRALITTRRIGGVQRVPFQSEHVFAPYATDYMLKSSNAGRWNDPTVSKVTQLRLALTTGQFHTTRAVLKPLR